VDYRAVVGATRGRRLAAAFFLTIIITAAVLSLQPTRSFAADLCLPSADNSCISSTVRSDSGVIAGAEVHVTGPNGFDETLTTDENGKFSLSVSETGAYTLELVPDSLDESLTITNGKVTLNVKRLNRVAAPVFGVRTADYSSTTSFMDQLLNGTFSGLRLGLLLALASIGLSLIYGTTGLSNFAHAEQVTLGGMLGYLFVNQWGLGLWIGAPLVLIAAGFSGWLQDFVMWKPLRRRGLGLAQMMIVTIGLSLSLQYVYQFFIGASTVKVLVYNPTPRSLGPISYTTPDLIAMGISIVVIAMVGYALLRTRVGRATRAVSDNPALASASGIDVDRVIRLVWIVATTLAGLSGLLYSLVIQRGMRWDSGMQILLLLFAAVTLGGLGTAFGALIGSLVIGLVVELTPVLGAPGDLKYASALLILILLLLVRPQGLLGRAERVG
jgi:branched-chain amino acid transport system permease protein